MLFSDSARSSSHPIQVCCPIAALQPQVQDISPRRLTRVLRQYVVPTLIRSQPASVR